MTNGESGWKKRPTPASRGILPRRSPLNVSLLAVVAQPGRRSKQARPLQDDEDEEHTALGRCGVCGSASHRQPQRCECHRRDRGRASGTHWTATRSPEPSVRCSSMTNSESGWKKTPTPASRGILPLRSPVNASLFAVAARPGRRSEQARPLQDDEDEEHPTLGRRGVCGSASHRQPQRSERHRRDHGCASGPHFDSHSGVEWGSSAAECASFGVSRGGLALGTGRLRRRLARRGYPCIAPRRPTARADGKKHRLLLSRGYCRRDRLSMSRCLPAWFLVAAQSGRGSEQAHLLQDDEDEEHTALGRRGVCGSASHRQPQRSERHRRDHGCTSGTHWTATRSLGLSVRCSSMTNGESGWKKRPTPASRGILPRRSPLNVSLLAVVAQPGRRSKQARPLQDDEDEEHTALGRCGVCGSASHRQPQRCECHCRDHGCASGTHWTATRSPEPSVRCSSMTNSESRWKKRPTPASQGILPPRSPLNVSLFAVVARSG